MNAGDRVVLARTIATADRTRHAGMAGQVLEVQRGVVIPPDPDDPDDVTVVQDLVSVRWDGSPAGSEDQMPPEILIVVEDAPPGWPDGEA